MNAFGKTGNAVDGALYSCVVDDADGTTHVAGIYTFNKTANTLTRNDTWNTTATTVDNNPTTNIALSAGTHTVRCDLTLDMVSSKSPTFFGSRLFCGISSAATLSFGGFTANSLYVVGFSTDATTTYTKIGMNVKTSAAGSVTRVGIYAPDNNGQPSRLLADSGDIDTSVLGEVSATLTQPITLTAGIYFAVMCSTGAIDPAGYSTYIKNIMGVRTDGVSIQSCMVGAFTYSTLPNPFAGVALAQHTGAVPYVFLDK